MMIQVGDRAPDFVLTSHLGKQVSLSSYRGKKNVVLVFFPLAWTPVCTSQVPAVQAGLSQFEALHAQVLGINVESIPGLKAWAKSIGDITYPLLSDFYPHGQVAQAYGIMRPEGFSERATFVVDKEGLVRYRDIHAIDQVPDNEEVFKVLRELESAAAIATASRDLGGTASRHPLGEAAKKLAEAVPVAEPVAVPAPEPKVKPQEPPATAQQVNIVMYCTPWCPDCRNAKRYLDGRGLKYTEVDISKDKKAERKARELAGGKMVTPTFDCDGQVVLDFDRKRLEEILGKP
jgi:peroxiredoxin/glutaredoxin